MKGLRVLCAQEYDGVNMGVVPCTRCRGNWDRVTRSCTVHTGCEHRPVVAASVVPVCPMSNECQHQIQALPDPCPVRARGMVCESALIRAGTENAADLDYSFHAMMDSDDDVIHERRAAAKPRTMGDAVVMEMPEISLQKAERALELAQVQHKKARIARVRNATESHAALVERTLQDVDYWQRIVKHLRGRQ